MSDPLMLGREASHGTVAVSFSSAPVNFKAKLNVANLIPEEQRGSQDALFAVMPGVQQEEWAIADSYVYHDSFGFFLTSALGLPESTVVETTAIDSVFKFLDDPASLSFQWTQSKRIVQAYQSLWCVVDKLTLSFDATGLLKWTASGFGMPETEIADPTYSFSTTRPLAGWWGAVTLGGGAFTKLVKGSVTISRNRKPFRTINNTSAPADMSIGNRTVEYDLTVDFASKDEYDTYKSADPTDALTVVWEDADTVIGAVSHPTLTVKLGTIGFESGEINSDDDLPSAELKGKAVYNSGDASSAVVTLRSTKNYETGVS